ncbi:MAG: DUF6383 domain-containing protein, partial [Bacteroidales bacterium]|nr:DUF6383 domain-containing protein [Bacteroidales bacterium]
SLAKWYGDSGFAAQKPDALSVMVYASVATQIKIQLDNPIDAENTKHEAYKNMDAETWTLLEYDLSGLTDYGYKQVAFQPEHAGTFYFDNVQLLYATETSDKEFKAVIESPVFTSGNGITVTNCAQREVAIYNINGSKVFEQTASSPSVTVNVVKGLYIVMVDQIPTKVIVK